MRLRSRMIGVAATAGVMMAGGERANAQMFPPFPDAIQCVFSGSGMGSGPRIFYNIGYEQTSPPMFRYRAPRDGTNYDLLFNATNGSYIGKSGVPVATTCDGQALADIQTAGMAYYFSGVPGSMPSGALVQFALSDCPTGWTRQTITTSTVILCQKD